jgi:hypothetical protein
MDHEHSVGDEEDPVLKQEDFGRPPELPAAPALFRAA